MLREQVAQLQAQLQQVQPTVDGMPELSSWLENATPSWTTLSSQGTTFEVSNSAPSCPKGPSAWSRRWAECSLESFSVWGAAASRRPTTKSLWQEFCSTHQARGSIESRPIICQVSPWQTVNRHILLTRSLVAPTVPAPTIACPLGST